MAFIEQMLFTTASFHDEVPAYILVNNIFSQKSIGKTKVRKLKNLYNRNV